MRKCYRKQRNGNSQAMQTTTYQNSVSNESGLDVVTTGNGKYGNSGIFLFKYKAILYKSYTMNILIKNMNFMFTCT